MTISQPPSPRRSPDFTARPYRSVTIRSSYNPATNFPSNHGAALRGAALAFIKPPVKPEPTGNTYTGINGAKAAASIADTHRNNAEERRGWSASRDGSSVGYRPRCDDNRGSAGPGNAPLYAAQHSTQRERARTPSQQRHSGSDVSSGGEGARRASVASNIAATRATARFSLQHPPPSPRHEVEPIPKGHRFPTHFTLVIPPTMGRERTDSAPVRSTSNLIGMFERNSSVLADSQTTSTKSIPPAPKRQSARPVLPPSPNKETSDAALSTVQKAPIPGSPRNLRSSATFLQSAPFQPSRPATNTSLGRSQSPRQPTNIPQTRPMEPPPPPPSRRAGRQPAVPLSSPPSAGVDEIVTDPTQISFGRSSAKVLSLRPPLQSHDRADFPAPTRSRVPSSAEANPNITFKAILEPSTTIPPLAPPNGSQRNHHYTDADLLASYASRDSTQVPPPPARRLNPHLTGDSLADAIVASSLASSRASSPAKAAQSLYAPNPPLPRRHSRHHLFPHNRNANEETSSNASPSKQAGLRQTMRKGPTKKSSNEEAEEDRRGRKHLIKKHPNKHHEGDRKRWRDAITERERKRYEGVWAANRGIFTSQSERCISGLAGSAVATLDEAEEVDVVSNLMVKEIWCRSRLANDCLEEVWDLVDRKVDGCLRRKEFVVGMWLIDQRLKGRKLPIKVQGSVWESVRRMGGVKVKVRK